MPKSKTGFFEKICTYDNFEAAWEEVAKGKRDKPAYIRFARTREQYIWDTLWLLKHHQWKHHPCVHKGIYEPKYRELTIPILSDRIVHHAVIRQLRPVFDGYYHDASYACRKGRGQLDACRRLQKLYRKAIGRWGREFHVISVDLKSFFASIDHDVLKRLLRRIIREKETLWILDEIIDATGKGIPIGFLSSQDFGNYLNSYIDYFVTDVLHQNLYIRYMDDIRILVHSRAEAKATLEALAELCTTKLKLTLSEKKTHIKPWRGRDTFCGYIVCPHRLMAKPDTVKRAHKRMAKKLRLFMAGELSLENVCQSAESLRAYLAPTFSTLPPLSRTKGVE